MILVSGSWGWIHSAFEPFFSRFPVEACQFLPGGRVNARGLRQPRQKLAVGLSRVPAYDGFQRRVGFPGGRVDLQGPARQAPLFLQDFQHFQKDRLLRFLVDQPVRAGEGRVVGERVGPSVAQEGRHDLLEVVEDRCDKRSTLITSLLPIGHWHDFLGDPTLADAILDRLIH